MTLKMDQQFGSQTPSSGHPWPDLALGPAKAALPSSFQGHNDSSQQSQKQEVFVTSAASNQSVRFYAFILIQCDRVCNK